MTVDGQTLTRMRRHTGMVPLETERGLDIFRRILATGSGQVTVLRGDRSRLLDHLGIRGGRHVSETSREDGPRRGPSAPRKGRRRPDPPDEALERISRHHDHASLGTPSQNRSKSDSSESDIRHRLKERIGIYLKKKTALILAVQHQEVSREDNLMDMGIDSTQLLELAQE